MGDRDGDDERPDEEPTGSAADDPAADEQQVPSSTAADAKEVDETAADEAEDREDAAAEETDEPSDTDNSPAPDDESGAAGEQDGDDGSGTDDDQDDGEQVESRSIEDGDTTWEPPTTDDFDVDYDADDEAGDGETGDADDEAGDSGTDDDETADDGESADEEAGDDPREWWKDHKEDVKGSDDDGDEGRDDDADIPPAARQNQVEDAEAPAAEADHPNGGHAPTGPTATGASEHPHAPETPTGGETAPARPDRGHAPDPEPATAPDDEEMPLTEHVEEMALRLLAVALVMFGVAGIVVFYAGDLVNFLWYSFLGDPAVCPGPDCTEAPRVLHPLAPPLAYLKASTLVGFIIALPVGVYQTYRFMRPGLYPRERRYYLAAVPTSLVLAAVGVGFAYFAVLPAMFAYFTDYTEQAAQVAFSLTDTFNLMILMLGFFALIFQIPLLVMLAIMMGVTTRQWLADRRLYFWGGFAAVAFVFSPDPTGMAPLIVAVTMIALFEATLTLLRWTGTGSPIPTAEEAADRRPVAYLVAALGGYIASAGPLPPSYYEMLPSVVTDQLAASGGPIATPAIIAGALIGLFEVGAFLLRRYGQSRRALKARLAVDDARIPVWMGAVVVGYFGSPEPTLLIAARALALQPTQAALVAVGLVALYELFVALLRRREEQTAEEPTTEEV